MLRYKMRRSMADLSPVLHNARRAFHSNVHLLSSSVPATVSGSSKSTWNFLGAIFGRTPPPLPPLYEPLPNVKIPATPTYPTSLETEVTTLDNGLRIASENTIGPTSTVGIYIDSGSIYETPATSGVSHLLERMAFKSTANRSHFRLIREVEAIGGNVTASASREQMAYTADSLKTFLPELLELLADSIRNPVFHEWEVKEQIAKVKAEVQQASNNPQSIILEALHSAGYAGALGNTLIAPEANLDRLNGEVLWDFVQANYTAPRMVLAAAGVDHEELKALADPLFSDLPSGGPPSPPPSQYIGGDWRAASNSPVTHIALGFELAGGWRNTKDAVVATVLQTLMGGGGSFSSGGPGKGMYSRLYTRVLNQHGEVQSCTAFNSIYNDTGLLGIYATAKSDFVERLVDIVSNEFLAVASPGGVSDGELQRAKNATIASVLMNLESRMVVAEDIGRQILTYGHRKPPKDFVAAVEAITTKDIESLAQKVLKTPLSMAAHGNVVAVPRLDKVASRFG